MVWSLRSLLQLEARNLRLQVRVNKDFTLSSFPVALISNLLFLLPRFEALESQTRLFLIFFFAFSQQRREFLPFIADTSYRFFARSLLISTFPFIAISNQIRVTLRQFTDIFGYPLNSICPCCAHVQLNYSLTHSARTSENRTRSKAGEKKTLISWIIDEEVLTRKVSHNIRLFIHNVKAPSVSSAFKLENDLNSFKASRLRGAHECMKLLFDRRAVIQDDFIIALWFGPSPLQQYKHNLTFGNGLLHAEKASGCLGIEKTLRKYSDSNWFPVFVFFI